MKLFVREDEIEAERQDARDQLVAQLREKYDLVPKGTRIVHKSEQVIQPREGDAVVCYWRPGGKAPLTIQFHNWEAVETPGPPIDATTFGETSPVYLSRIERVDFTATTKEKKR